MHSLKSIKLSGFGVEPGLFQPTFIHLIGLPALLKLQIEIAPEDVYKNGEQLFISQDLTEQEKEKIRSSHVETVYLSLCGFRHTSPVEELLRLLPKSLVSLGIEESNAGSLSSTSEALGLHLPGFTRLKHLAMVGPIALELHFLP